MKTALMMMFLNDNLDFINLIQIGLPEKLLSKLTSYI